MSVIIWFLIGFIACLVLALATTLMLRRKGKSEPKVKIFSSVEEMRAIGELHVFKVVTKEIVTETNHVLGEGGTKYFEWLLSSKKMAMIFEFDISFSYNLKENAFDIVHLSENNYRLKMPPCRYDIHIKDIEFYDEQRAKLLPLLLPDFVNKIFSTGFGEEERNALKDAAKEQAQVLAKQMVGRLASDVRASAEVTLYSIARSFGAERVDFEYAEEGHGLDMRDVDMAEDAISAA